MDNDLYWRFKQIRDKFHFQTNKEFITEMLKVMDEHGTIRRNNHRPTSKYCN